MDIEEIKEIKEKQWGGHLSNIYHIVLRYAWGEKVDSYRKVKELFDEAFVWHEQQVEEGYLPSYGGQPFSPESRQAVADVVYENMAKVEHRFPQIVERLKVIMDCIGRNADSIENILDMRKIIFLDFDGVMVTEKYMEQLMADGYSIEDEYGSFFDSNCVKNLKEIIDFTDAEIVVTSTWKMTLGLDGLQAMWETRNLPGKVVGVTPDIDPVHRGDEIQAWLDAQMCAVRYAILDDCPILDFFREDHLLHLFKVDEMVGLDEETVKKVIDHLFR